MSTKYNQLGVATRRSRFLGGGVGGLARGEGPEAKRRPGVVDGDLHVGAHAELAEDRPEGVAVDVGAGRPELAIRQLGRLSSGHLVSDAQDRPA